MNYPDTNNPLPGNYFKTMTLIHLALIIGQVMFAIVSFNIAQNIHFDMKNTSDPLFFAVPGMTLACTIVGAVVYQKLLRSIPAEATMKAKMGQYQTALIVRYALLEGPSLMGIVAFLLSGNLYYLVFTALLILIMASLRPTRDKMENELNLSFEEKMEF